MMDIILISTARDRQTKLSTAELQRAELAIGDFLDLLDRELDVLDQAGRPRLGCLAEIAANSMMKEVMVANPQFEFEQTSKGSAADRRGIDAYLVAKNDILEITPAPKRGRRRVVPRVLLKAGTALHIDWTLAMRNQFGQFSANPKKDGRPFVVAVPVVLFTEVQGLDHELPVWLVPDDRRRDFIGCFEQVMRAWLTSADCFYQRLTA